jgi:phosphosulfolactate synthase (CoM biosynthesis protein A)
MVKGERGFEFIPINKRENKPRKRGVTEIRGPYYSPMGKRYLEDILETVGWYVDHLKFAGGSFSLMPRDAVKGILDLCHEYEVEVSTGGFMEYVLTKGETVVEKYIQECKKVGFDIIEVSAGFITIPPDDWVKVVKKVQDSGIKAKPEIGIQFGAGGASSVEALEEEGTIDVGWLIEMAKRFYDVGVERIMIESEGITENVRTWRTDVINSIMNNLNPDKLMFEAADPQVFSWYIKNYGPEVNLFVDHSQIVQLECLRSGIWGVESVWGRVVTYKE